MSKTKSSELESSVSSHSQLEPATASLNTAEQICAFIQAKQNDKLSNFLSEIKDPDFSDKEWHCRKSPVQVAIESGNLEALSIIGNFDRDLLFQQDSLGNDFLFYAASHDLDISQLAEKFQISVDELSNVNDRNRTAAHIAAEENSCRFLNFLNSQGVDLFAEDNDGTTPIDLACAYDSVDAMSLLLDLLRDDDLTNRDEYLKSLVEIAIDEDSLDCFKHLVEERKFNLEKLSEDFYPESEVPLLVQYQVAVNNAAKIAGYLLDRGVIDAHQLETDHNFLVLAVHKKAINVLNLLGERDPNFFSASTGDLAGAAVDYKSSDVLGFLVQKNPQYFQSEQTMAWLFQKIEEQGNPISLLLPLSQIQSPFQESIKTHIACDVIGNKRQDLYGFLEHFFTDYTAAAEKFRDHKGRTLAHIAAMENNRDVLEMMSTHDGIKFDHHSNDGYKPLHLAAALNQSDALEFLFRKCVVGCEDKEKRYSDKWSSLRVAAANNAVKSIETMIGADDESKEKSCKYLAYREFDKQGRTLGFSAAKNDSVAVLKFLYESAVASGDVENLASFKHGVITAIDDKDSVLVEKIREFAKPIVDEVEESKAKNSNAVSNPASVKLTPVVVGHEKK